MMVNRTRRYLGPILNTYPKVFLDELSKVEYNLCVWDVLYHKSTKREFAENLFLIIPYKQSLIDACRNMKLYVDEYPLNLTTKYVVVLDVPDEFKISYRHYLKGEYSKMYTNEQMRRLRINEIVDGKINATYLILTHHKMAMEQYPKIIKEVYGTDTYSESPDEYDVPPRISREVLNFQNNEDYIKQFTPLRNN